MDMYVCIILGNEHRIVTVKSFSASSEAEARARANSLVAAHAEATTYQLWIKGKKLPQLRTSENAH
jgi:hypothetical protein